MSGPTVSALRVLVHVVLQFLVISISAAEGVQCGRSKPTGPRGDDAHE